MANGHGGKRRGAGRPPGTGWTSAVGSMRTAAAERLVTIVGTENDPLEIVLSIAADTTADTQTRLGACSIALPYVYPRLSATTVDAKHTTVSVDAGALLARLDERISRLGTSGQPAAIEGKAVPHNGDAAGGTEVPAESRALPAGDRS